MSTLPPVTTDPPGLRVLTPVSVPVLAATDGELLNQYARHGDEQALQSVVERHSAMVWSVCLRLLNQLADAEDAFQATMLILARKASSVRANDSAGGWLFRVAYHTSLTLKRRRKNRRETELPEALPLPEEKFPDFERRQMIGVLIEELRGLPDKYQTPLVLRYLEGKSRRQIAEATDTTVATIAGRLMRGKRMLRLRLARRGVSLAVAMAAVGGSQASAASTTAGTATPLTPPPLFDPGLAASGASAVVSSLVTQGVRSMLITSLLKPAAVGAACTVAALAMLVEAPSEAAPGADASGSQQQLVLQATAVDEPAAESVRIAVAPAAAPESQKRKRPEKKAKPTKTLITPKVVTKTEQSATISVTQNGKVTDLNITPTIKGDQVEIVAEVTEQEEGLEGALFLRADGIVELHRGKKSKPKHHDVEAAREHWANVAKNEGGLDLSQPSFAELYTMRLHWSSKEQAVQQKLDEATLLIKQGERPMNADLVAIGAELYEAKAKILELERQMKQAALRETGAHGAQAWRYSPLPPTPAAATGVVPPGLPATPPTKTTPPTDAERQAHTRAFLYNLAQPQLQPAASVKPVKPVEPRHPGVMEKTVSPSTPPLATAERVEELRILKATLKALEESIFAKEHPEKVKADLEALRARIKRAESASQKTEALPLIDQTNDGEPLRAGETLSITLSDKTDPLARSVHTTVKINEHGEIKIKGLKPIKVKGQTVEHATTSIKLESRALVPKPVVTVKRMVIQSPPQPPRPEGRLQQLMNEAKTQQRILQYELAEQHRKAVKELTAENQRLQKQLQALQLAYSERVEIEGRHKQKEILQKELAKVTKKLSAAQKENAAQASQLREVRDQLQSELKKFDAQAATPPAIGKIQVSDRVMIEVYDRYNDQELLRRSETVDANGDIALGARWGRVKVSGKSLSEAEEEITREVVMQLERSSASRKKQPADASSHFDISVQVTRVLPAPNRAGIR